MSLQQVAAAGVTGVATYFLLNKLFPERAWPRAWQGDIPKMNKKTAKLVLNVPQFYTQEQLQQNYRALLKANHPDRGGSVYLSQLVTEAFKELDK